MSAADPVVVAGAIIAAVVGLLPPRFAVPALVAVATGSLALSSAHEPAAALLPACAFLIVALARAAVRERTARIALRTSFAAEAAAESRAAVLAERARIVGDIHDVVAHSLSGMLIHLMAARALLDDAEPELARTAKMLDRAIHAARAAVHKAHDVVGVLHGDTLGWSDIRQMVEDFAVTSGVRCTVDLPAAVPGATSETCLVTYYAVQEALTNAARHGAAESVRVRATVGDGRVCVEVDNDASPAARADPGAIGTGRGLRQLRDRAAARGGELVAGPTASGYRLRLEMPVEAG